jgi:hypothetical protein
VAIVNKGKRMVKKSDFRNLKKFYNLVHLKATFSVAIEIKTAKADRSLNIVFHIKHHLLLTP